MLSRVNWDSTKRQQWPILAGRGATGAYYVNYSRYTNKSPLFEALNVLAAFGAGPAAKFIVYAYKYLQYAYGT